MPDGTPVAVGGGGAPRSVKYLVQVASASLPNAQAMAALGTGLVKNTTATGVQSIAAASDIATTLGNQSANVVYAGPSSGGAAAPTFRALVAADLPAGTGTVTSVGLSSNATWLTVGSSPITSSGTITLNLTTGQTANQFLATPNGSTGTVSLRAIASADLTTALTTPPAIGGTTPAAVTGTAGTFANLVVAQTATTGSPASEVVVTGAAHTALTASTEYTDVNFNLARTIQFNSGALTTNRSVRFQAPTIGFTSASTVTNAITFEISGAPVAGTNATITVPIALNVASGLFAANGGMLLNQTGSTTKENTIYVGGGSTGASSNMFRIYVAGYNTNEGVTNGPLMWMRGNTYSTISTVRGNIAFAAGSPSSPAQGEGQIQFSTGSSGSGTVRLFIDTNGYVSIGGATTVAPSSRLHVIDTDATTTATTVATLYHKTSLTGSSIVAGMGATLLYQGDTNGGSQRDLASIRSEWTTAADATRASKVVVAVASNTALTDILTVTSLSKVLITGPAASLTNSPSLQLMYTSDADAAFGFFAYDHDNVAMAFDAWYNGTAWQSSNSGSNFSWYKSSNTLYVGAKSGITKGSTFGSFTNVWQIDPSGNVIEAGTFKAAGITSLVSNTATTGATIVLTLDHELTSGTADVGLGAAILFAGQSTAANNSNMALINSKWDTPTTASRKASLLLAAYDTAIRPNVTIGANGSAPTIGVLGATAVARQTTYTQTYSTATSTVNPASTGAFTGVDNLQVGSVYALVADLNQLRTDMLQAMQLINQLIDNEQAYGWAA